MSNTLVANARQMRSDSRCPELTGPNARQHGPGRETQWKNV